MFNLNLHCNHCSCYTILKCTGSQFFRVAGLAVNQFYKGANNFSEKIHLVIFLVIELQYLAILYKSQVLLGTGFIQ